MSENHNHSAHGITKCGPIPGLPVLSVSMLFQKKKKKIRMHQLI